VQLRGVETRSVDSHRCFTGGRNGCRSGAVVTIVS
jgi:hypothetical protein